MKTALTDIFAIDPTLAYPIPCRVKFTREAQKNRAFLFLIFVVTTLFFYFWSRHDLYYLSLLESQGITTQGVIYDKNVSYGKTTYYSVDYQYIFDGYEYHDSYETNLNDYQQTNINDIITVTVLQDQPNIHEVGVVTEERLEARHGFWKWIISIIVALLGGLSLWLEAAYQKQTVFLKRGWITMGETIDKQIVGGRTKIYRVNYIFFTNGKKQLGSAIASYNLYQRWIPGSAVAIVYNPRFPRYSLPCKALTHATLVAR